MKRRILWGIFLILNSALINKVDGDILTQIEIVNVEIERFGDDICDGPEDVTIDNQGNIYTGMHDGRIIRFDKDLSNPEVIANTEGRPLGLEFDSDGNLIICDAYKGLLAMNPAGDITVLTTECDGVPFKLTEDVDIADDGTIYFSDGSYKYGLESLGSDHGEPNGRLMSYNPVTKETKLVMGDILFANGVAVSPDQSFVLVSESDEYRVLRYWLSGSNKGETDVFIDDLPGTPDNINTNGKDMFWLAIYGGPIYGIDVSGEVIHYFEYSPDIYYGMSCVQPHDGFLYLGSYIDTAVGRVDVSDVITAVNESTDNNPTEFSLLQNYPNPFNPTTTITYNLNQPGMVNLVIYDLLGRKVTTLVDEVKTPGSHKVTWNAQGFASGMYFYQLKHNGSEVLTQKMILVK